MKPSALDRLRHFVYEMHAADGEVLYVGCTSDPFTRMANHYKQPYWPLIAALVMDVYPDRASGRAEETRRIALHQPQYNQRGTDKPQARPRRAPLEAISA